MYWKFDNKYTPKRPFGEMIEGAIPARKTFPLIHFPGATSFLRKYFIIVYKNKWSRWRPPPESPHEIEGLDDPTINPNDPYATDDGEGPTSSDGVGPGGDGSGPDGAGGSPGSGKGPGKGKGGQGPAAQLEHRLYDPSKDKKKKPSEGSLPTEEDEEPTGKPKGDKNKPTDGSEDALPAEGEEEPTDGQPKGGKKKPTDGSGDGEPSDGEPGSVPTDKNKPLQPEPMSLNDVSDDLIRKEEEEKPNEGERDEGDAGALIPIDDNKKRYAKIFETQVRYLEIENGPTGLTAYWDGKMKPVDEDSNNFPPNIIAYIKTKTKLHYFIDKNGQYCVRGDTNKAKVFILSSNRKCLQF